MCPIGLDVHYHSRTNTIHKQIHIAQNNSTQQYDNLTTDPPQSKVITYDINVHGDLAIVAFVEANRLETV